MYSFVSALVVIVVVVAAAAAAGVEFVERDDLHKLQKGLNEVRRLWMLGWGWRMAKR